jgi:ABC-type nitrate/sulfonate/bicarbonate transport system substrate-binding protein
MIKGKRRGLRIIIMGVQNSFCCFTTAARLLGLAVCVLANCRAIVWSAESLKFGFSGATATQLAGSIAIEQKLFERYGVRVEFTQSAGTTMIRALDSGSLQVAIVGGGQALSAYFKGVEVRIISGLVNAIPFQLWVKPEIAGVNDLKGKLIANTPPGTSLNLANQVLLARAGLDSARDVKLIAFGRLGLVSQALFTGVVDAALLSPPETTEAKKSGLHMIIDMATARIPCPFTSVVTTRAMLAKEPLLLGRFLKAILHGVSLALTNPDLAKKTIGRTMRLGDPEAIEAVYQRVTMVYERFPIVSRQAIDTIIKVSPEPSNRNPYAVVDMSLLERIEKEGFVRLLYSAK